MGVISRVGLLAALCCSPAVGASLLDAWDSAQAYDPDFRIALADHGIAAEELPLARAALLPQMVAQAAVGRAESDITQPGLLGGVNRRSQFYDTQNWALQIRQPLFRFRALTGYQQGRLRSDSSDAALEDARQQLALRLLESLARMAAARADAQFAEVDVVSSARVLEQSERQLKAGQVTQADRANASARHAQAETGLSQAKVALAVADAKWQQLTGGMSPNRLSLPPELVAKLGFAGVTADDLATRALAQSPALASLRRERDIARLELRKARGERLPTLDLLLSRGYVESDVESTIGNTYLTNRVALQATLPLYAGGAISATVRQAEAKLARAEASVSAAEGQLRSIVAQETSNLAYAGSQKDSARVSAEAAGLSQRAAELGRSGGTSTRADASEAETALAAAQRDQVRAAALALISWARIMHATGALDRSALENLQPDVDIE
ncbi:MAG TPA: TolC family protein [Solimonas sp.]|nr:TolC family protein [Solimonas sp.]